MLWRWKVSDHLSERISMKLNLEYLSPGTTALHMTGSVVCLFAFSGHRLTFQILWGIPQFKLEQKFVLFFNCLVFFESSGNRKGCWFSKVGHCRRCEADCVRDETRIEPSIKSLYPLKAAQKNRLKEIIRFVWFNELLQLGVSK